MTFRQFAINNVLRNKRLYVAYFLSSLFTVMVFFTFANFAFHPSLLAGSESSGNVNSNALYGMAVAGGIIYVFSFFFVMYSMSSFLQSRKREFGLLMIQGMSTKQIRLMVFMENMLIGLLATVSGIGLGLVFSKLILMIAENVLVIEQSLPFYFPTWAIIITFASFIILFLLISFFVSFILRSRKLIDLIKANKISKGEPKASLILTIIAAILLIAGYGTALYVKGLQVVFALIPVVIVVIIGTYLLFTQLSVFFIRKLKTNESLFWRKTNMLLFSDLSFRMKDNARTFFMVAVISTVAFSAIGTLFGLQSYLTSGLKNSMPYTYVYNDYLDTTSEELNKDIKLVDNILKEKKVATTKAEMDMQYYVGPDDHEVLIVKASDYNHFATLLDNKHVNPKVGEAIVVKDHLANMLNEKTEETLINKPIVRQDGSKIKPESMLETNIIPEMYAYYIVNDTDYQALQKPDRTSKFIAWEAANGQGDVIRETGGFITDQLDPGKFSSVDYITYEINKVYGPILFIGLFIGIVFFVSAGSFLYFRLYTDLDEDKEKFKAIAKLGLTDKELNKVINRQTIILFFSPIIVALLHGAVALTALSHLFDYNLVKESTFVLGGFAAIQIIYYLIVRFFYTKQIKTALRN